MKRQDAIEHRLEDGPGGSLGVGPGPDPGLTPGARVGGLSVRLENLTLAYDRHPAVHHLSGTFRAGSLTAVVGPNGAGKSTLLKGLAGLMPPASGRVRREGGRRPGLVGGRWSRRSADLAYLPQAAEVDRDFPLSVFDLVALGLWSETGLFRSLGGARVARVGEALAAVGLAGFEARPIGTLSGGQLQRALFARVILQDAALILLDEPFAAVDARTIQDLVALIHRWTAEGRTVVAVLHDLDLVRRAFPETLLLARSPVAWGPTAEALSPANLAAAGRMPEAPDPFARPCAEDEHGHGHHAHAHPHAHGHEHAHGHVHHHDPAHPHPPAPVPAPVPVAAGAERGGPAQAA